METSLWPEKLRLKLMFHEFVAKLSEAIPLYNVFFFFFFFKFFLCVCFFKIYFYVPAL